METIVAELIGFRATPLRWHRQMQFFVSLATIIGIGIVLAVLLSLTSYNLIPSIIFHTFWNGAAN